MLPSRLPGTSARRAVTRVAVMAAILLVVAGRSASAQAQPGARPEQPRVVVIGEGSIGVPPDYAQIRSGVTVRAKTVREATEASSRTMTAMRATLSELGIDAKDIQTLRFSIQPIYASTEPRGEQKLMGYSVSNQVSVKTRDIDKVGPLLDKLVSAGATDIGGIEFLVADPSRALDQAREAAVADARRKAELYARAFGVELGRIAWISEESATLPPVRTFAAPAGVVPAAVPIAAGEDTLRVKITVGFDLNR